MQPVVNHQVQDVRMAAEEMIREGWIHSADQFKIFKEDIWARNTEVVRWILNNI
jgi:hypothetical protein